MAIKAKIKPRQTTQELDDKQDKIYYGIDIYGNTISLKLVMYSIKKVNKDISDKEIF